MTTTTTKRSIPSRLTKPEKATLAFSGEVRDILRTMLSDPTMPGDPTRDIDLLQPHILRELSRMRQDGTPVEDAARELAPKVQTRYRYRVSGHITVDRPDLRDSSYRPVPAGFQCILPESVYAVYSWANRERVRALAGEDIYAAAGSEYVSHVKLERQDWHTGLWTTLSEYRRTARGKWDI